MLVIPSFITVEKERNFQNKYLQKVRMSKVRTTLLLLSIESILKRTKGNCYLPDIILTLIYYVHVSRSGKKVTLLTTPPKYSSPKSSTPRKSPQNVKFGSDERLYSQAKKEAPDPNFKPKKGLLASLSLSY